MFVGSFNLDPRSARLNTEMGVMLDSPPDTLGWTREGSAGAYQLITRIRWHYQQELNRRGLMSAKSIDGFYDKTRLQLHEMTKGRVRVKDCTIWETDATTATYYE